MPPARPPPQRGRSGPSRVALSLVVALAGCTVPREPVFDETEGEPDASVDGGLDGGVDGGPNGADGGQVGGADAGQDAGVDGGTVVACTVQGDCASGQACVNNLCVCDASSCRTGCCDGVTCKQRTSDEMCGSNGAACVACSSDQACVNGGCVCLSESACASGQACVGGACVCNAGSCPHGCCDSNNLCQTGDMDPACGLGGTGCATCTSDQSCTNQTCVTRCDTNTCANGCCDQSGHCQTAETEAACGTGAQSCSACATDWYCVSSGCHESDALQYNGSGAYVDVPDTASLRVTGPMTIEAWVYLYSFNTGQTYPIVSKNDFTTIGNEHGWNLKMDSGVFEMRIENDGYSEATAAASPALNVWIHIAGTYDGSTVAIWQDGTKVGEVPATNSLGSSTRDLLFGVDVNPGNPYFDGVIDEVRLSNTVRYGSTFIPEGRFTPDANTVALWHFDEGQGSSASDASGNGHTGALVGPTWVQGH
jgi:hypothetical protein